MRKMAQIKETSNEAYKKVEELEDEMTSERKKELILEAFANANELRELRDDIEKEVGELEAKPLKDQILEAFANAKRLKEIGDEVEKKVCDPKNPDRPPEERILAFIVQLETMIANLETKLNNERQARNEEEEKRNIAEAAMKKEIASHATAKKNLAGIKKLIEANYLYIHVRKDKVNSVNQQLESYFGKLEKSNIAKEMPPLASE